MGKTIPASRQRELVEIQVSTLKERLNKFYDSRRRNQTADSQDGLFEYLWDLKELALMEGRASVEVPSAWLEELDSSLHCGVMRSH
ncbi:MAG: hypothetical protein IPM23_26610 [Candidatus Melainabacteria bacterium]|nr:hypothetical protein [Candidatus Melainabacteria bacterium]